MRQEPNQSPERSEPNRYRVLNDAVIRYILGSQGSENDLKAFINAVFADRTDSGIQVEELTICNPFDPKTYPKDKQANFDLLAIDNHRNRLHLEFQVWEHRSFVERCLYYWSRVYARQIQEGNEYWRLHPAISVIVTDFQIPQKLTKSDSLLESKIHKSFSIRDDDPPYIPMTDHFRMHFIQLPKTITPETLTPLGPQLAKWVAFFGYPTKTTEVDMESIANSDPNIQAALASYNKFHQDPALRILAESCEDYRRDVNEYIITREEIGEARGKVNQTIKLVIRWLERTVATPSKEIRSQIESITDLEQIDLILDKVLMREIHTLEDLKPYLSSNDHGK